MKTIAESKINKGRAIRVQYMPVTLPDGSGRERLPDFGAVGT